MKVLLDEQGYVKSYAVIGDLVDGIDLPDPEDALHFEENFNAYKVHDGTVAFDAARSAALHDEAEKQDLRDRRQTECFAFVNRGQLWYATLSVKQLAELTAWYKDWLKVTETKVVPERPAWLE